MILTVHILTGAAIATKVPNPFLGLFLAFLSHYLLDFIPHREYIASFRDSFKKGKKTIFVNLSKVAVDFLIGFSILLILSKNKILVLTGGLLAILPDLDNLFFAFPFLLKIKFLKIDAYFHFEKIHFFKNKKIPLFWEVFNQIFIFIIAILFLLQ